MYKFLFALVIALCGTHTSSLNTERANRILIGTDSRENQFPFMISLQQLSQVQNYTRGHRCGGAMLTQEHAVIAASCNFNNINGTFVAINPNEYRVFAGSVRLTNDSSPDRIRLLRNITVHPQYNPNTPYVNDIAIIFLASPFTITSPVPLAITDTNPNNYTVACTTSGWGGQNATSNASVQLRHHTQLINNPTSCAASYANVLNVTNYMICAWAGNFAFSSCTGDTGNPLVCGGNLNGILIRHKTCVSSATPEVYTRISSYRTWINSFIGSSTTSTAAPTTTTSPSPPTSPSVTTSPPPNATTTAPGAATTFQPGMVMLTVLVITQIITAKVLN